MLWSRAAAPAKPALPPLPFAHLGRMEDGGRTTVFLQRGDDVSDIVNMAAVAVVDAQEALNK